MSSQLSKSTPGPLASVIIVTYNAADRVIRCVEAVLEATIAPIQVIVVDNGSTDDTVGELERRFGAHVEVVALSKNLGPAAARNVAVRQARGRYLAFLDNDTVPHPDWLEAPLARMEADPTVGACQCKLLLLADPTAFDYAGDYLSSIGFLIQRVHAGELDEGQADEAEEIFSAKSAGMVMLREAFDKAGGFDDDYFIYVEETDLGWRVWLQGYRIVFEPRSVVLHEFGTSTVVLGDRQRVLAKFYGPANYLTTIFKCAGFPSVVPMLTLNAAGWLGVAGWLMLRGGFRDAYHIGRGLAYFALFLPRNWRKRREVQRRRTVTDRELYPRIRRRRSFRYFYEKLAVRRQVGHTHGYYRTRNEAKATR